MGRLNQSKILRQKNQKAIKLSNETWDAIVWDVQPDQKTCRVKRQGSSKKITVNYPENWEKTPVYLKSKNAVKIMHTGGNRTRLEVVGHGQYIPSPVPDETEFIPSPRIEDHIISGREVVPYAVPAMGVLVKS